MFENPRRGRQARNFTANVPKILGLKSSFPHILKIAHMTSTDWPHQHFELLSFLAYPNNTLFSNLWITRSIRNKLMWALQYANVSLRYRCVDSTRKRRWVQVSHPSTLGICSCVIYPSVIWNLLKAQRWRKSIWTSDRCHPHLLTFGYYYM